MKSSALRCLWIGILLFVSPLTADACSCAWSGPFLSVSKNAPLVIHGRILRHHPGQSPAMDVLVLETLKGILKVGIYPKIHPRASRDPMSPKPVPANKEPLFFRRKLVSESTVRPPAAR